MLTKIDSILIPAPHLNTASDNGVLEVDALWQQGKSTAILCHPNPVDGGTMNNKVVSTMYRYCRDKGMNVIRYNSRGVGKSSGLPTATMAEFDDAKCVYAWAKAFGVRDFWLGGFSFGGFMASLLADFALQDDVRLQSLCLIAPSIERHDAEALHYPKNSFMIYGSQDKIVSPSALARFAIIKNLPTKVIETGHFFHHKLTILKSTIDELDRHND